MFFSNGVIATYPYKGSLMNPHRLRTNYLTSLLFEQSLLITDKTAAYNRSESPETRFSSGISI